MEDAPLFRASKRRKASSKAERGRSQSASEDESTPGLIKPRHQLKARPRGVQVPNSTSTTRGRDDETSKELTVRSTNDDEVSLGGLQSRFVGSGSGRQVVNVDKHMYVNLASIFTSYSRFFISVQ